MVPKTDLPNLTKSATDSGSPAVRSGSETSGRGTFGMVMSVRGAFGRGALGKVSSGGGTLGTVRSGRGTLGRRTLRTGSGTLRLASGGKDSLVTDARGRFSMAGSERGGDGRGLAATGKSPRLGTETLGLGSGAISRGSFGNGTRVVSKGRSVETPTGKSSVTGSLGRSEARFGIARGTGWAAGLGSTGASRAAPPRPWPVIYQSVSIS